MIEPRPGDAQAYIRDYDLYGAYRTWTEGANELPAAHRKFNELVRMSYTWEKTEYGMRWLAIRLRRPG